MNKTVLIGKQAGMTYAGDANDRGRQASTAKRQQNAKNTQPTRLRLRKPNGAKVRRNARERSTADGKRPPPKAKHSKRERKETSSPYRPTAKHLSNPQNHANSPCRCKIQNCVHATGGATRPTTWASTKQRRAAPHELGQHPKDEAEQAGNAPSAGRCDDGGRPKKSDTNQDIRWHACGVRCQSSRQGHFADHWISSQCGGIRPVNLRP